MTGINSRRVLIGGIAGGLVFIAWCLLNEFVLLPMMIGGAGQYEAAMAQGLFLAQGASRLSMGTFIVIWMASLFVIAYGIAWAYAAMRATAGAGPGTAVKLGLIVGFAAGFPMDFAHGVFQTLAPAFWFSWGLEMLVGSVLAALTAGWVYKDA